MGTLLWRSWAIEPLTRSLDLYRLPCRLPFIATMAANGKHTTTSLTSLIQKEYVDEGLILLITMN